MKIRVPTAEAAVMLGVKVARVHKLIEKRELDAVRCGKQRLMVSTRSIYEYKIREGSNA